ncbi:11397_t:CDS:2 [Ambispora leptoticha]|uniref:11397_t:CDS:1 n=1 Tax=Ambispora leptoticha TaxID=144679 RepID=A0A9N9D1M7_9GLOM|nr:11397_t:CDS:2 [Ambispora leptoticha]
MDGRYGVGKGTASTLQCKGVLATKSQFSNDESSRKLAMERELARIVDEPLTPFLYGNNNRADGIWLTTIHDQMAYRLIWEKKSAPWKVKIVSTSLKQAIKALHDQNIVFADLRRLNILVVESQNQYKGYKGCKGMLMEFDWCGTHNLDTYLLEMSEIPWSDGARPGALLMKAHDEYWLDMLKEDLNFG